MSEANKNIVVLRILRNLLIGGLEKYGASSKVGNGRGNSPFLVVTF